MATRDCPFCGKEVYDRLTQCPYCRETLAQARRVRTVESASNGGTEIRRGLLCVLLATLIGYFAGGYSPSPLNLPFPILPMVTTYLSPLLFFCGISLTLHGYYLQHKDTVRASRST
jgi:hypothetical protein